MSCNYNHVAFLVADIDIAIAKFSKIFGVEFNPPSKRQSTVAIDGVRHDYMVTVTYSRTEPFIELIEGMEDGYYSLSQGEGFHHIGTWAEPFGCGLWHERFDDLAIGAEMMAGEQVTIRLTDPASCHGVRIELVDEQRRAEVEKWIMRDPEKAVTKRLHG